MLSRVLQEWVLKRLYRFVLKPVLGKLLDSELDLAQLDVQFLNGTVELRDLLLNKEYISGLLVRIEKAIKKITRLTSSRSPPLATPPLTLFCKSVTGVTSNTDTAFPSPAVVSM